jgi:hypothetical protein
MRGAPASPPATTAKREPLCGPISHWLAAVIGLVLSLLGLALTALPAAAQNVVGAQPAAMILAVGPTITAAPEDVGLQGSPQLRLVSDGDGDPTYLEFPGDRAVRKVFT